MSIGAYRDFIRLVPIDPKMNSRATVSISHIIGWQVYSWTNDHQPRCTSVWLSNGECLISNESVEEFEARLDFICNNIYIHGKEEN